MDRSEALRIWDSAEIPKCALCSALGVLGFIVTQGKVMYRIQCLGCGATAKEATKEQAVAVFVGETIELEEETMPPEPRFKVGYHVRCKTKNGRFEIISVSNEIYTGESAYQISSAGNFDGTWYRESLLDLADISFDVSRTMDEKSKRMSAMLDNMQISKTKVWSCQMPTQEGLVSLRGVLPDLYGHKEHASYMEKMDETKQAQEKDKINNVKTLIGNITRNLEKW